MLNRAFITGLLKLLHVPVMLILSATSSNGQTATPVLPVIPLAAGDSLVAPLADYLPSEMINQIPVSIDNTDKVRARISHTTLCIYTDEATGGYGKVHFLAGQSEKVLVVRIRPRKTVEMVWQGEPGDQVTLFGSFNNWDRNALPLSWQGEHFGCRVSLFPGSYPYRFHVNGEDKLDPGNPEKVPNGFGDFNSLLTVEGQDQPELYYHDSEQTATHIAYRFTTTHRPDESLALWDHTLLPPKWLTVHEQLIEISIPRGALLAQGVHTLRLGLTCDGQATNMQTLVLKDGLPDDEFRWQDAILYSLVVDRFRDGDPANNHPVQFDSLYPQANFHGGDLAGIIQAVDEGYFDQLAVNTLWISPLNQAPQEAFQEYPEPHRWFSGYHGYWPVQPRAVDPRFGTMEQLQELAQKLHRRDQKILMDFVAHHVHEQHPYTNNASWFGRLTLPDGSRNLRRWDEYRLTTWFEPFLPTFDFTASAEARRQVARDAVWWLQTAGLDGFRQDAVKHTPLDFWRELGDQIIAVTDPGHPLPFQIGETFGSHELIASYIRPRLLNAQFNFNLFYTTRRVLLDSAASFSSIDRELKQSLVAYGDHHLMGNLIDSHDQVRFMAYADGDIDIHNEGNTAEIGWHNPPQVDHASSYDKLELFMGLIMTTPGIPVVYYGDEIGMTGAADPDNRRDMIWDHNDLQKAALSATSALISIRNTHPALRRGDFRTLMADQSVYAYLRSYPGDRVLTVIHKGAEVDEVALQVPKSLQNLHPERLHGDGSWVLADDMLNIKLPPWSVTVMSWK